MNIIKNFLTRFKNITPDDKHIFGRKGENYVRGLLIKNNYHIYCNRILKNQKSRFGFLETDIILSKGTTIFVIEIKRMKGRIFRTDKGLIQEKMPAASPLKFNPYNARVVKNPLNQVKYFTIALRKELTKKDKRFYNIDFIPVVTFSREADITDIYSFEKGIIYFDNLIPFIEKYSSNKTTPSWILNELNLLKGFDIIVNRDGYEITGFIMDTDFTCITKEKKIEIDFADIENIKVKRGIFLSLYDNVSILLKNKKTINLKCKNTKITVNTLSTLHTYFLKNLTEIKVESR